MKQERSGILLRGEKYPGSKPPHGGSWLRDPETDTLILLEPPSAETPSEAQATAKYAPSKLDPDRTRFYELARKPFLSKDEYRSVLSLWKKFGYLMPGPQPSKEIFIRSLIDRSEKCREMIRQGRSRLSESEREDFVCLLRESEGDPLRFLNLTGVPLGDILAEMEYLSIQKRTQDLVTEMRRSKVRRKDAANSIRKAAQHMDDARPLVDGYLWWANHLDVVPERLVRRPAWEVPNRDQYPRGDWLRAVAWILENAEKLHLIPSGTDRKGGPRKDLLGYAAYKLRRICESAMEESLKQERDEQKISKIFIGRSILWGSLTAILMASFPKWFVRDVNPVRNVRNAFRKYFSGAN